MKNKLYITTSTFPRFKNDTIPNFVFKLARDLAQSFDLTVFAPYSKGSKSNENMEGVTVNRYKYLPFNLGTLTSGGGILPNLKKSKLYFLQVPFFLLGQFWFLIKKINRSDNNVIFAHWIIPQGIIAVLYKKLINNKVKILVTSHGGDIFSFDNYFGNLLKKFVLNNVDAITVVSNAIKNKVMELGYKKEIFVFPMGIDTTMFSPEKYDSSIKEKYNIDSHFLLFVGRIVEKKGLIYLLKAMPAILSEFPKTKLLVIGDGPEKENLESLSKQLNIQNNVLFLGAIQHNLLPSYFATADIFIGPSIIAKSGDREGFGLVFAEAMSSGTIVIATNLKAVQDIVNKDTGFIVEQKNPTAISDSVIKLLKNKNKLDKMKLNARNHIVKNYDSKIVKNNYEKVIKRLFKK